MKNDREYARRAFLALREVVVKCGYGQELYDRLTLYAEVASKPYNPTNKTKKWMLLDDRYESSIPAKVNEFAFTLDLLSKSKKALVVEGKEDQLNRIDVRDEHESYQLKNTREQKRLGVNYFYVHEDWGRSGPTWLVAVFANKNRYFMISPQTVMDLINRKGTGFCALTAQGFWIRQEEFENAGVIYGTFCQDVSEALLKAKTK